MAAKRERRRYDVSHPPQIRPDDLLSFVHHELFLADWKDLGSGDDDLRELEVGIMLSPAGHPVIAGTGGLRKIRFVPKGWHVGKSGACRAIYALFPEVSIAILMAAYAKNEKEDINADDRKTLRLLVNELHGLYTKDS